MSTNPLCKMGIQARDKLRNTKFYFETSENAPICQHSSHRDLWGKFGARPKLQKAKIDSFMLLSFFMALGMAHDLNNWWKEALVSRLEEKKS